MVIMCFIENQYVNLHDSRYGAYVSFKFTLRNVIFLIGVWMLNSCALFRNIVGGMSISTLNPTPLLTALCSARKTYI